MKMPETIPEYLFAPCGINCMVCYMHLKRKKACIGCLGNDVDKPERCKMCAIKKCATEMGCKYCFQCNTFPCIKIKNLEKSYITRYGVSILGNSNYVGAHGIVEFQNTEILKWKCKKCCGVMSLHDGVCSECGEKHENYYRLVENRKRRENITFA